MPRMGPWGAARARRGTKKREQSERAKQTNKPKTCQGVGRLISTTAHVPAGENIILPPNTDLTKTKNPREQGRERERGRKTRNRQRQKQTEGEAKPNIK